MPEQPKVLLVEDDPKMMKATSMTISLAGCTAVEAADLKQARKAVKCGGIQAVILDVDLPDGSRFNFCRELRTGELRHVDVKEGRYRYADHDDKNIELANIVVYDEYKNTDDYETMKADQLQKWENASGKYLFLLSWTLTPSLSNPHVHILANKANAHLLDELKKGINSGFPKPNIVYIDFMNENLAQSIAAFNF